MKIQKLYIHILFSFSLCFLTSCSFQRKAEIIYPVVRKHQVSVVQDGKEISAEKNRHVHHVKLLERRLPFDKNELPFEFVPIEDSQGRIRGLMAREKVQTYSRYIMGFTKGDILTSIEQVTAQSDKDIRLLLDTLRHKGKATVSLERKGEPHKIFFSIVR